jgi:membrane protein
MKMPHFVSRIPWLSYLFVLVRETTREWLKDGGARMAASLAYYTVFSLAPLLIIVIAVAGFFFGETQARDEILTQLQELMGRNGAQYVRTLLDTSWSPSAGVIATALGFIMLLLGATGAFAELQESLNQIWDVEAPKRSGLWTYLRRRLISFSLVLTMGFLMMVSLVLSAILSAISKYFTERVPAYFPLFNLVNWLFAFGVTAVLFAAIYKILPDLKVRWKNVWLGAAVASLLFSIGRYFIGLYLGQGSFSSVYGAAGSFVVILLWVYYSSQILFYGAEFTWVCAQHDASGILAADADSKDPVVRQKLAVQKNIDDKKQAEKEKD